MRKNCASLFPNVGIASDDLDRLNLDRVSTVHTDVALGTVNITVLNTSYLSEKMRKIISRIDLLPLVNNRFDSWFKRIRVLCSAALQ